VHGSHRTDVVAVAGFGTAPGTLTDAWTASSPTTDLAYVTVPVPLPLVWVEKERLGWPCIAIISCTEISTDGDPFTVTDGVTVIGLPTQPDWGAWRLMATAGGVHWWLRKFDAVRSQSPQSTADAWIESVPVESLVYVAAAWPLCNCIVLGAFVAPGPFTARLTDVSGPQFAATFSRNGVPTADDVEDSAMVSVGSTHWWLNDC
jgi:hypothetical protein